MLSLVDIIIERALLKEKLRFRNGLFFNERERINHLNLNPVLECGLTLF